MLALGAAFINAAFFSYPRVRELPPVRGVTRIEVSGDSARVTLAADFAEQQNHAVLALTQALRERGVKSAVLVKSNGTGAGQLSVAEGKVYGFPAAPVRNDVALPVVPAQPAPQAAPPPPQPQAQPAPQGQPPAQPKPAATQAPRTQTAGR